MSKMTVHVEQQDGIWPWNHPHVYVVWVTMRNGQRYGVTDERGDVLVLNKARGFHSKRQAEGVASVLKWMFGLEEVP